MPEKLKAANFGDIFLDLNTNYDINCQLINFDVTKHNEKGNRYQDCVLWDGYDQKKVKVWEGRNGIPLEEKNRNQWLTFSLSARAGTGKWKNNKYLGGFWDSSAAIIDSLPQPQQDAQRPNIPQQQDKPDWDAIARGKVRNSVVCAYISSRMKPEIKEIERWVGYIMSGRDPDNIPHPHSDIQAERCEQCGALDVTQCSCNPW